MKPTTLYCLGLLALPLAAHAIDAGPASPQQQETEGWLQLQARNKVASDKPQTASATEREIPQFWDQDAGGKVYNGGSGG
jgi:hypothetical protein